MTSMLLLDGPLGTELQRRGADTTLPLWSARALRECPDLVLTIHRDYVDCGADVVTTNTFRTNARAIVRAGLTRHDARELTHTAVRLAREAAGSGTHPLLVAGSDAPVEDCYEPGLVPGVDELYMEHREHCEWLMEEGCDVLLLETMNTLREAVAAARAANDIGAKYMISMVTNQAGDRVLGGESLESVVDALEPFHPSAILTNCSAPQAVLAATEILAGIRSRRDSEWDFGGYANSGNPDPVLGWDLVHTVSIADFVDSAKRMIDVGAGVIGSCCGTTPDYIRAIRESSPRVTRSGPAI